jgi:integrase
VTTQLAGYGYRRHAMSIRWCGLRGGWLRGGVPASAPPWPCGRSSNCFHKLVLASGLPPVRVHDLRHGAATLALAAGADLRVVQGLLGHASIVLTADTYTSVLPQLYHDNARATARLVLKAARKTARKVNDARPGV